MKTKDGDVVRLVPMNPEHDRGPEEKRGLLPARWCQACERVLAPPEPDWLGMTELTYSQTKPTATAAEKAAGQRWQAAQDTSGMRGFPAEVGQGRNPTRFVRGSVFTIGPRPQHHHPRVSGRRPPTSGCGCPRRPRCRSSRPPSIARTATRAFGKPRRTSCRHWWTKSNPTRALLRLLNGCRKLPFLKEILHQRRSACPR